MSLVTVQRLYDEGWRVALVGESGRKWTPLVVLSSTASWSGVELRKIANDEVRELVPLAGYPVPRALRHFRRWARELGATQGAKDFLAEAVTA